MLHLSSVTGWLARLKVAYTQAILGPLSGNNFSFSLMLFSSNSAPKRQILRIFLFNCCNKKCVPDRFSCFDIFRCRPTDRQINRQSSYRQIHVDIIKNAPIFYFHFYIYISASYFRYSQVHQILIKKY